MSPTPKNHNKPSTTPDKHFTDLDRDSKESIQKILHVPMPAKDLEMVLNKVLSIRKKNFSTNEDIEIAEVLQDKITSFLSTKGSKPDQLIRPQDIVELSKPELNSNKLSSDQLKAICQDVGMMLSFVVVTEPSMKHLIRDLDKQTTLGSTSATRSKNGDPQPFKQSRSQLGGLYTYEPNQEADPIHEKKREDEKFINKLASVPLPAKTVQELLDSVKADFEYTGNDVSIKFVEAVQKKIKDIVPAEDGEHIDLATITQAINTSTGENQPPKFSENIVKATRYRFAEQFDLLADLDSDVQEIQNNIDDFTLDTDIHPADESGPYPVYGKEGCWVPEERDDALVWVTKEQKEQTITLEKEADKIVVQRDLGRNALVSMGIAKMFGKLKNRLLFRNSRKNHHEKKKTKKDRLIKRQRLLINAAQHEGVKNKRQAELNNLISAHSKENRRTTELESLITKDTEAAKRRDILIARKEKSLGNKKLREYKKSLKKDFGYSKKEVNLVRDSITKEQRALIGKILLFQNVAKANTTSWEFSLTDLSSNIDDMLNTQSELKTSRKGLEAEMTSAGPERVKAIKNEIYSIDNELNTLESEIADLKEELQSKEDYRYGSILNKKVADYTQLEKDWEEEVAQTEVGSS